MTEEKPDINKLLEELSRKNAELEKLSSELEIQRWGVKKTNEGIRTLYKELEKKNEELRKLDQLKSDFLSFVSHELRTPLTTIKETVSQTLEGLLGPTTPKQQDFLSMCLENIERLARIINNLLDLSKIEAGKTELKRRQVDISALAKKVCLSFSTRMASKGLEMKTTLPDSAVEIYIDEDKVVQVLNNLIGNSIKFTPQGSIEVRVADKGDSVECSVSDTGKGISEEDAAHLFTKFRQFGGAVDPAEKGTGLGLAITRGIVELHHGSIRAESKLGQGTKFIFILPKYTPKEILKEHLSESLKTALQTEESVSALVLSLSDLPELQKKLGKQKADLCFNELGKILGACLRNREKIIVEMDYIFAILREANKEQAMSVKERVLSGGREFLEKNGLDKDVTISWKVLSFPEDGSTVEQLCAGL